MLGDEKMEEKYLYHGLSIIGTIGYCSDDAKQSIKEVFAEQLKDILNKAKKQSGRCQEIANDCNNLFEF